MLEDVIPKPENDGLEIGEVFAGRYEIMSLLGRGGMGAVYEARQIYMKKTVALKTFLPGVALEDKMLKRFQKEAQAASALQHQNIITIHDFGISDDSQAFLVMEFVKGRDLNEDIQQRGPISVERFAHIFCQACDALAHAHKNGVVHRDIKDTNIMLVERDDDSDHVQIVDFGLAKISGDEDDPNLHLTQTGAVVGTPLYMSPEQCRGQKCDARSDVYSLGCVMYKALTGQPPFIAETIIDVMHKHLREFPTPMALIVPNHGISRSMERIVAKCLAKNPEDRYQTMLELKHDLMALPGAAVGGAVGGKTVAAREDMRAPQVVTPPINGTKATLAASNEPRAASFGRSTSRSGTRAAKQSNSSAIYWVAALVIIGCLTAVACTIIAATMNQKKTVTTQNSESDKNTFEERSAPITTAPAVVTGPTTSVTTAQPHATKDSAGKTTTTTTTTRTVTDWRASESSAETSAAQADGTSETVVVHPEVQTSAPVRAVHQATVPTTHVASPAGSAPDIGASGTVWNPWGETQSKKTTSNSSEPATTQIQTALPPPPVAVSDSDSSDTGSGQPGTFKVPPGYPQPPPGMPFPPPGMPPPPGYGPDRGHGPPPGH